jgi:hypothetical protein
MTTWTSGYLADIGYTYGYYNELNPKRAELAILNAGYAPASSGVHCELGFGQGLSVNIHAAASGAAWYGCDFNPSQASFAQSLAAASGANVDLTDESFADFCNRTDHPDFDSIGLHGIWSWISDENRTIIVDFIRRRLKVGGALYVSYNTLPGWANFAPMRHLMTEHAAVMGSLGKGVVSRVEGALEFAQKLLDTNPLYARDNTAVAERLKKVAEQNRSYLAHEYFNKDWLPMHFATMSHWLTAAKLNFVCSAHYLDNIQALNLTPEQQELLKEFPDPIFKETVRDFMVNRQFRRDYWIKGARKLSALEQAEIIRQHTIVLTSPHQTVALKVKGALGEVGLKESIYEPILELMGDHKFRSIGEVAEKIKIVSLKEVIQATLVLVGAGHMVSVQANERITVAKKSTNKLNQILKDKARFSSEISFLASPVSGGGVAVDRIQQLFLLAIDQSKKHPKELANTAWTVLASQNQRLVKEGKTIETAEDNLDELTVQAEDFLMLKLPILKAMGIA